MKKIVALPLIAAVALGAAACSKKSEDNSAMNTEASADMNAAANDAIADVNAATEAGADNASMAMDNASAMNASDTNASNAM
ncbi:hypothetical protein [Sphingomonas sp.]|uniref:hypothetical protein n=1 Tax=Sphingomonas sp. TaxID=28214 RepID=UPI003AFFAE8C